MKGSVSQIGPYRIEEKIGTGGMGSIYRGVREGAAGFQRPVAIKILHPHLSSSEEYVRMFHAEARLAARLAHPVLVPVRDLGALEGTHFMVMDLLEGETLADLRMRYLKKKKELPRGHVLHILAQVLDGLHYAHELNDDDGKPLGVVHRDVSPRNIFVTGSGAVRLVDFGIARSSVDGHGTQAGVVKGTVPYMPPEQALGQPLDRRADIFAVGVLLHELLTGTAPLETEKTEAQRAELARMEISPRLKEIHVAIRPVVARALSPKAEDRYETAAEMADALRQALEQLEPTYDPMRLGALASLRSRRKGRASRKRQSEHTGEPRPSTQHRRERRAEKMRRERGSEMVDTEQPLAWDAGKSMALLATIIGLATLLYTFLPPLP